MFLKMLICIETPVVHLNYDMTHLLIDCSESVKIQPTYVLGLLHMTQFSPLLLVLKRCSVCIQKGCVFLVISRKSLITFNLCWNLCKNLIPRFFTLQNIVLKCTNFSYYSQYKEIRSKVINKLLKKIIENISSSIL